MGRLEDVDWAEWVEAVAINLLRHRAHVPRASIPSDARAGLRQDRQPLRRRRDRARCRASAPTPRPRPPSCGSTETLAEELRGRPHRRQRDRPGRLNTRLLDEVLDGRPGARSGSEFYEQGACSSGTRAARRWRRARRWPRSSPRRASDGITGRLLSAVWDDWARLPERRDELAAERRLHAAPDRPGGPGADVVKRVGHRRLRPDRAASARAALGGAAGWSPRPTSSPSARERLAARASRAARPSRDWRAAVTRPDVDVVIVATTNDALAPVTLAAVRGRQARAGREAGGPPRRRSSRPWPRRPRERRRGREGRLQPPLPPRAARRPARCFDERRARPADVHPRRATATAAGSATTGSGAPTRASPAAASCSTRAST